MSKRVIIGAVRYWLCIIIALGARGLLEGSFSFFGEPYVWVLLFFGMIILLVSFWFDYKDGRLK